MITADEPVFPNNVVDAIATRMGLIDADIFVTKRPLRESDPLQSIGVFGALWTPNPESVEMRGFSDPGPGEPTLSRYVVTLQAFVKDADEERGLATHSVLSATIRAILYRDIPLRTLMNSLSVQTLGVNERLRRWGVTAQRFVNNELDSQWLYLSSIELWAETQTDVA